MKKVLFLFTAALCLSTAVNAQNIVFQSSFSGNANDQSGNNLHGTVNGATLCPGQNGAPNTAYLFDGVNDYIQLPTDVQFNLTQWTIQTLVKINGFYTGPCQSSTILWHGAEFSNNFYTLYFGDNMYDGSCTDYSPEKAFASKAAGNSATPDFQSTYYNTNGFLDTGIWYCVTTTYDGTDIRLYIDGTLVDEGPWANQYNISSPVPTYIGTTNDPVYPYWLNGVVDQVILWDGAIDSVSIANYCDSSTLNIGNELDQIGRSDFMIDVFPNPAQYEVSISMPQDWQGATLYILDGIGRVIRTIHPESERSHVDVKQLPTGIYIIKAISGDKISSSKFVIE